MEKYVEVFCKNNGRIVDVEVGSTLMDMYRQSGLAMEHGPINARVNNKVEGMHFRIYNPKEVEFLDIRSASGLRAYTRTLFFVLCKAVHDLYTDKNVNVDISIPGSGQSKRFEWGPSCYKEAVKVLENVPEGELNPQHGEPSGRKTKTALEMLPDSVRSNRNLRSVYLYIARHPNCNATDIKTRNSVSQTTVNRILGQLKREGVIEYQGSKKYGGYRIVES